MLKKAIRKIIVTTFIVFIVLTIYLIPTKSKKDNKTYRSIDTRDISVYLVNDYDQLTRVEFKTPKSKIESVIESIINKLTISNDATIPKKFKQVIPSDVELKDFKIDNNILYLYFSKELLDNTKDNIELIIESVSYSMFELEEINGVSIYVDDENLSKAIDVPEVITREYGINKRTNIKNFNDVSKVTIFYIDSEEDKNYYVPITKYVNDKRDKIKIIIDELSSNYVYESNLISLLDKNSKLLDYEIKNDCIILDFNNSIFIEQDYILEEIVYSVFANYDVNEVIFRVEGKETLRKNVR